VLQKVFKRRTAVKKMSPQARLEGNAGRLAMSTQASGERGGEERGETNNERFAQVFFFVGGGDEKGATSLFATQNDHRAQYQIPANTRTTRKRKQ